MYLILSRILGQSLQDNIQQRGIMLKSHKLEIADWRRKRENRYNRFN